MLFRPPSPQILAVPHIQQRRTGECLAACAWMICSYLRIAVDYQRLVRLLEIQQDVGASFSKIHNLEKLRLTEEYVYLNDPEWPDAPIQVSIGDFDLAWLARGERFALFAL